MTKHLLIDIIPEEAQKTKHLMTEIQRIKGHIPLDFNSIEFYNILDFLRKEMQNENPEKMLHNMETPGRKIRSEYLSQYKHKLYDLESVLVVLCYMQENDLSILEASRLFKISRNTISKWRKQYSRLLNGPLAKNNEITSPDV